MPHDTKTSDQNSGNPTQEAAPGAIAASTPLRISSAELFAGGREIEIDHNGRRYQLRITQTGKLILTA